MESVSQRHINKIRRKRLLRKALARKIVQNKIEQQPPDLEEEEIQDLDIQSLSGFGPSETFDVEEYDDVEVEDNEGYDDVCGSSSSVNSVSECFVQECDSEYDSDNSEYLFDGADSSLSDLSQSQSIDLDSVGDVDDFESGEDTDQANSMVPDLFSGSNLSGHQFSVALLSIMHKHSVTNSCVEDLLSLLSNSFPSPNAIPPTHFLLTNKFGKYDHHITKHNCCSYCTQLLPTGLSCTRAECQAA